MAMLDMQMGLGHLLTRRIAVCALHRRPGGVSQLPQPKPLKQSLHPNTCWAAALSCWLAATRGQEIKQMSLYEYYLRLNFCNEYGLDPHYLPRIFQDQMFRMRYEIVNKTFLDREYLDDKLRQSYLYMAMSKIGVGHAVVVFSVYVDQNGYDNISIMDPASGQNITGPLIPFLNERSDGDIYVGWVDFNHEIDGKAWWQD